MTKRRRKRRIYPLGEFRMIGFTMANALPGDQNVPVLAQATMISDEPFFHHCMKSFAGDVDARLRAAGIDAHLAQASSFAIVVEKDFSAKLYFDGLDVSLAMVAKRAVQKGEGCFTNDIGDIYRGQVTNLKLTSDQHWIVCLRQGWKFLLIFDLAPEQPSNVEALERSIGFGLRRLLFEELYLAMEDEHVLGAMIAKGWFPFNELIGAEFENLQKAISTDFNLENVEQKLVAAFDRVRLDLLLDRWWRTPQFAARRELLAEGVALFVEKRFISSIKTLLTEVEGILRERHVARTQGRQGMEKVLAVAFEEVVAFAGAETMYFPQAFVDYLKRSVFSPFDPDQPATEATRNTVGHGRAPSDAYTPVRALQTILLLDQISRFLTLPTGPSDR